MSFFENTGTPGAPVFAEASTNPFGLADVGDHASPDLVDLDGDGDLDALVGGEDGSTAFFENTGSASAPAFAPPTINPFGLKDVGARAAPSFVDIDADGDLDAFTSNGWRVMRFLENVEIGPGTCDDGLDNEGDGRIDAPSDPGCTSTADTDEKSTLQCDNGLDDDGDGRIDWREDATGDPQCASLADGSELAAPGAGCGIGPELLLLAPLLAAPRRRRRRG
jgi:hypothetical protein